MRVAVGTYLGDGADDRSIAIPYWGSTTPSALFVRGEIQRARARTSGMAGDFTLGFESMLPTTNIIQALQAGGFQVGSATQANKAGTRYYYLALGGANTTDISLVSYVGDASNPRSITGAGFAPDMAIIWGAGSVGPVWSSTAHGSNITNEFDGCLGNGYILAFEADGIQISGNNQVNGNTQDFYVLFLKKVTGRFNLLAYTGNGTSKSVSGAGFRPDFAYTEIATAANFDGPGQVRFYHQVAPSSCTLYDGDSPFTDSITALETDGFRVGARVGANENGISYVAPVFKASVPIVGLDGRVVSGGFVSAHRPMRHMRQVP